MITVIEEKERERKRDSKRVAVAVVTVFKGQTSAIFREHETRGGAMRSWAPREFKQTYYGTKSLPRIAGSSIGKRPTSPIPLSPR